MATVRAATSRERYQARPGRAACVAAELSELHGPATGSVRLPLWLCWSTPDLEFDLGDPDMRRWLYQIVLREAASPADLDSYLDSDTLVALWPDLWLPPGVRRAWEDRHPVLRAASAA